jgi:hypothetical protein
MCFSTARFVTPSASAMAALLLPAPSLATTSPLARELAHRRAGLLAAAHEARDHLKVDR